MFIVTVLRKAVSSKVVPSKRQGPVSGHGNLDLASLRQAVRKIRFPCGKRYDNDSKGTPCGGGVTFLVLDVSHETPDVTI